jgi:hypothetical protein
MSAMAPSIDHDRNTGLPARYHAPLLLLGVGILAFFFANVEIQIEGAHGWAAALPVTFRIEHHWLLDVFWGGRPMTGYHAWVFPFVILFFHLPMLMSARWSWRFEARAVACSMLFWIVEDALWFALNPAFGWAGLRPCLPGQAPCAWWHVHWFMRLPTDYWTFSVAAGLLLGWSFRKARRPAADRST